MSRYLLIIPVLLLLVSGCALPLSYDFVPKAVEVKVQKSAQDPTEVARVMVSILQVAPDALKERYELHVRFRCTNVTDHSLVLLTGEMEILSGDLQSFGPPRVPGGQDPTLTPGSEGVIEVFFPIPPGEVDRIDFSTLKLRWSLEGISGKIPHTITFHGKIPHDDYHYYYGHFYYPRYYDYRCY